MAGLSAAFVISARGRWQLYCLCLWLCVFDCAGSEQGTFRSLSCGQLCSARLGLAVHLMRVVLYVVSIHAALQAGGSIQYACPPSVAVSLPAAQTMVCVGWTDPAMGVYADCQFSACV